MMRNLKASVVRDAAKVRGWDSILEDLCPEIDARAFSKVGRHVACPVHGKTGRKGDGFRFFRKDFHESGGGICNTCGAFPDGFALLQWLKGIDFADAVSLVGDRLDIRSTDDENVQERVNRQSLPQLQARREAAAAKQAEEDTMLRNRLNKMWAETIPLTHPDAEPARLYLASRKILIWDRSGLEGTVRFHRGLASHNEDGRFEGEYPAIVAKVSKAKMPITLHRHFLTARGEKAPVENPKKMCAYPSDRQVTGGAICTGQWDAQVVDLCEGLETAFAIETGMDLAVRVYPAVSATLLEAFEPGPSTKLVRIWIDKDRSGRGEEAAKVLRKRLWERNIQLQVFAPPLPIPEGAKGVDWNDVLLQLGRMGFPQWARRAVA
ncbi:DUF7146 domain-containing protein [Pseudomonas oryzihabitans]|uniref:DUF7146 domain-containing protein n=1 Tax=Pseudomonas oryzihabitans TaxID=47885 RepID=UPI001F1DE7E3|nr:toprim domain-containing protein [Pseudomonas oryzihabitans]